MILNRFEWFRRLRGGKWGKVTGMMFGKKWIKLPEESKQYDEIYYNCRELLYQRDSAIEEHRKTLEMMKAEATNDRAVDVQILKYAIKAQDKMISAYRTGKPQMPEWVFDALKKVKDRYGNDLQKII